MLLDDWSYIFQQCCERESCLALQCEKVGFSRSVIILGGLCVMYEVLFYMYKNYLTEL